MASPLLFAVLLGHAVAGLLLAVNQPAHRRPALWSAAACFVSFLACLALLLARFAPESWDLSGAAILSILPGLALGLQAEPVGLTLAAASSLAATVAVTALALADEDSHQWGRPVGFGLLLVSAACGVCLAATLATVYVAWMIALAAALGIALSTGDPGWSIKIAVGGTVGSFALLGVAMVAGLGAPTRPLSALGELAGSGWPVLLALLVALALGPWGLPGRSRAHVQERADPMLDDLQWLAFASLAPPLYLLAPALGFGELGSWSGWQAALLLAALGLCALGASKQLAGASTEAWLAGARQAEAGTAIGGLALGHPIGVLAFLLGLVNLVLAGSTVALGQRLLAFDSSTPASDSSRSALRCLLWGYATLSLAGLPPLLGFAARWLLLVACLETGQGWFALGTVGLVAVGPLTVAKHLRRIRTLQHTAVSEAEVGLGATLVMASPVVVSALLSMALFFPVWGPLGGLLRQVIWSEPTSIPQAATFAWLALLSVVLAALAGAVMGRGDQISHRVLIGRGQWHRRSAGLQRWACRNASFALSALDVAAIARQWEDRHYVSALLFVATVIIVYSLGY